MICTILLTLACVPRASAAACPNEELRLELHSGLLPDCRSYELVTPSYKEGSTPDTFAVSEDGEHVIIGSLGAFASVEGGSIDPDVEGAAYLLSRTPTGWMSSSIQPPESRFNPATRLEDVGSEEGLAEFSNSLWALGRLTQPEGVVDLYLRRQSGELVEVGPPTANPSLANYTRYYYAGGSADLSHVLFAVNENSFRWPFDTTLGTAGSLYEYVGTGNTKPVFVGASGGMESAALISQCGTRLGSSEPYPPALGSMYNAVSSSGARVFFTAVGKDEAPGCGGEAPPVSELFAREQRSSGESQPMVISEPSVSYCSPPPPATPPPCADAHFEGASRDGSKVFFTTTQKLLEGATEGTSNLYEYDFNSAEQKLTLVSGGSADAAVQGVARISEDGSHVYFVAQGKLTSVPNVFEDSAIEGHDNLYVSSEGHTSFVAMLAPQDEADWQQIDERPVQASSDGRFLVFSSSADLTHEETIEGVQQIYRYDAQTGSLVRASIGQGGYNSNGRTPSFSASLKVASYAFKDLAATMGESLAPADGSVFFESPTALTPQTQNDRTESLGNLVPNVYEYENGEVYLISDGQDASAIHGEPAVHLLGASASGSDVFFTTSDALIPQDGDTQQDLYDAREEGGFPAPKSGGCGGETCQGQLSAPPSLALPGSTGEAAAGNVVVGVVQAKSNKPKAKAKPKPKAKKKRKPVRKKGKRRAGKTALHARLRRSISPRRVEAGR